MILGPLALALSLVSVGSLMLNATLQHHVPHKLSNFLTAGGLIGAVMSLIMGIVSINSPAGFWATVLSGVNTAACGTAYLRFRNQIRRQYKLGSEPVEIIPPKDDAIIEQPPPDLRGDGSDEPAPGPVPVETSESPGCALKHLQGYSFLQVALHGSTWRKKFTAAFLIYPGKSRIDFYLTARGTVFWGLFNRRYQVKMKRGDLYVQLECIDDCTKILLDPWGTLTVTDGALAAGFSINQSTYGTNDTIKITISVAASLDETVSVTSNIPGLPNVSVSEGPSEVSSLVGSNVYKCVKTE